MVVWGCRSANGAGNMAVMRFNIVSHHLNLFVGLESSMTCLYQEQIKELNANLVHVKEVGFYSDDIKYKPVLLP